MFYERIKLLRQSVAIKIAAIFFFSFSLFLSSALVVSYYRMSSSLAEANQQVILSKWREMDAILSSGGPKEVSAYLNEESHRLENASFMVRVLMGRSPIFQKVSIQQKMFDFENGFERESLLKDGWTEFPAVNDEDRFEIFSSNASNGMRLQVGQSSEGRFEVLESLSDVFVWIGAIFSLMSGAFGIWYARKVLAPVRSLTKTVKGISSGRFELRSSLRSTDLEFKELSMLFDSMVDRIQQLIGAMKSSVENIAHDLRTPLARISILAERAILNGSEADRLNALQECSEYSHEISEFITQVLEMSEVEAGTIVLHKKVSSLRNLVHAVVDAYEFVALEKEINLQIEGTDVSLNVDEKRFKQAIGNLIDNAIKFSPSKSEIRIEIGRRGNQTTVSVIDQGSGISDDNLPHIFERLFRGDRSRSTKGAGIGLAVVQSVAKAHGGSVEVKTEMGKGSAFTLVLNQ